MATTPTEIGLDTDATPTAPRYAVQKELGRGGWGSVYLARDRQIDRDVAIKQINAELAGKDTIQERFWHEAQVTGQLQHPGIVPVHELGVGADGAPFYVMKLLEGSTFRDAIRQSHANESAAARGFSVELLERFIDVCHAVGYAHKQGVIHRDLKPANIMVGLFGETIVVDWGLAKRLRPTEPSAAPTNIEATLAPGTGGGTPAPSVSRGTTRRSSGVGAATRHGLVLGTPAYMSPEQSRGEVDALTPATDIYALGVILYEVLTGENPFRSEDVETTLSRVRAGDYRPPRDVNSRAPAPLAAICQKAMAVKPEDRYEDAEQIVDDLHRFLSDEPVSCYAESRLAKAARWCRRRPAQTAGAVGAGSVLLVASLVFGAVIHQAHQAELTARLAAEAAQERALERLSEARAAGDAWLIDLSGALQFFPGTEGLRERLIGQATQHYESLLASVDTEEGLEGALERARCEIRLGDLQRLSDSPEEAKRHYAGAASLLTGILDDAQDTDAWRTRTELANSRVGSALLGEEVDLELEAAWLCGTADQDSGALESEASRQAASAFARLAIAAARTPGADIEQVTERLVEAERMAASLVEKRGEPRDEKLLQTVRDELAGVYERSGHSKQAAALWRTEVADLGRQIEEHPRRPDLLQSRAFARLRLAGLQVQLRDQAGAIDSYRAAIDDLQTAWRLSDADSYYRRNMAVSHANLGRIKTDGDEAYGHLADAIEHLRHAVALEGPAASDLVRLAECYESLGVLSSWQGREDVRRHFDSAEDCYAILVDHGHLDAVVGAKRARAIAARAVWLADTGDVAGAEADLGRAEVLVEMALNSNELKNSPERGWVERLRASLLGLRCDIHQASGQTDRAAVAEARALQELRRLAAKETSRQTSDAYPVAAEMLVDRLLESGEPTEDEMAEAQRWLEEIAKYDEAFTKTGSWLQRQALLQYLQGETQAAHDMARASLAASSGDAVTRALVAVLEAANSEPDLSAIQAESPGDRRLKLWLQRLARPQG